MDRHEGQPTTEPHPLAGSMEHWEAVIDDMEATAAEYRDAGWETVELHPGDVTPIPSAATPELDDDWYGLDVLVPSDEFETVEAAVAAGTFDAFEAFRAQRGELVFLVLAMQAEDAGTTVLVPLYYGAADARPMLERATDEGAMHVRVRQLSEDRHVVFTQDDPSAFGPE